MREPTRRPDAATTTGLLARVEPPLELRVQRDQARPGRVRIGTSVITSVRASKPQRGQDPLADEVEHAVEHRLRPVPPDEVEVLVELRVGAERGARLVDREERQLAAR